jgi:hypothetical protein
MAVPPTIGGSNSLQSLYVNRLKATTIIGGVEANPALQSIANLTTSGNEMIYTIASNTYTTSPISGAGRSLVSAATASDQQTLLQLIPGTDVQIQSNELDSLITIGGGAADNMLYTTGVGYSNTTLTPFARTDILTAASTNDLATTLGYVIGATVSTTDRLVNVSATNTVTETGVTLDSSNDCTGINDLAIGNDLTVQYWFHYN